MFEILRQIRWTDVLDVALVALLVWVVFGFVWRLRTRLALQGVLLLGLLYAGVQQLDLQLSQRILQGFTAVLVLVLVVIFQDDLRRFFEQVAVLGFGRRSSLLPRDSERRLAATVEELARTKTGALLVFPGRESVEPHVHGGVAVDGRWSEPLLLSLFEPRSPTHDGAVIVDGERVRRFGVHLPLSIEPGRRRSMGTRHTAALGLAERCDALCVVVSEERGTVSIARDGTLKVLADPAEVEGEIRAFVERKSLAPTTSRRPRWRGGWIEAAAAVAVAVVLWIATVPTLESSTVEVRQVVRAPVQVENLPDGFEIESIAPPVVEVTIAGPRDAVGSLLEVAPQGGAGGAGEAIGTGEAPRAFVVRIDAILVSLGRRTFRVQPSQVERPEGVEVLAVEPEQVRLSVRRVADGAANGD